MAYAVGCPIDQIPALFAGSDKRSPVRWTNPKSHPGITGAAKAKIIADSARPETIDYLDKLAEKHNHVIDALHYAVEGAHRSRSNSFTWASAGRSPFSDEARRGYLLGSRKHGVLDPGFG